MDIVSKKFFEILEEDFLTKASPKNKTALKKIIRALLKARLITINKEEIEEIEAITARASKSAVLKPADVESLMYMTLRLLTGELERLKSERRKGVQVLDFSENAIATDFTIPRSRLPEIKRQCKESGWEVTGVNELTLSLKKIPVLRKKKIQPQK